MKTNQKTKSSDYPLCVDLDGTLIKTDILLESLFALLKYKLGSIVLIPFWLLKGKANLKQQIANRVELDVNVLPYHAEFLAHLRKLDEAGHRLILVTASNIKFAHQIAEHLGLFTDVLASDDKTNLSGEKKAECLLTAYGNPGFDYAANSWIDLPDA